MGFLRHLCPSHVHSAGFLGSKFQRAYESLVGSGSTSKSLLQHLSQHSAGAFSCKFAQWIGYYCQRRSKNASAGRSKNTSAKLVRVAAGWVPWADASVAINSVIPHIAHAAKFEKPRLVSMTTSQSLSPRPPMARSLNKTPQRLA